jgi:hypothetical protein
MTYLNGVSRIFERFVPNVKVQILHPFRQSPTILIAHFGRLFDTNCRRKDELGLLVASEAQLGVPVERSSRRIIVSIPLLVK